MLDLETTGVVPTEDAVVEVAVVLVDTEGESEDDWQSLVRPRRALGASHIRGDPSPS